MDHHHLPGSPSRTPRSFGPPAFPFQQMLELQHHHSHHHGDTASMPQQQQLSEDDENSPNRSSSVDKQQQQQQHQQQHKSSKKSSSAAASGSGELAVRKPRGRPPGSKNKPKPPIIITRDTGSGMRPHVLEVAPGTDLVEAIAGFARRKQRGVVVLSAKGSVTNITLLRQQQQQQPQQQQQQQQQQSPQPSRSSSPPSSSSSPPPPPSTVTYNGRFELLSMSGAFLQQLPGSVVGFSNMAISVAGGPQGQVIGGNVAGPLLAATPVVVIATSFLGPTYERLPLDEQDEQEDVHRQQSQALQGTTPIPIHQLMNDPFGLHHPGLASQLPPPDVLASWAAAAAAAGSGVRPPL